jgi:twitching motility protein PilI
MPEELKAYSALVDLSRQSLGVARGLPAQIDITPHWSGIGFELLGAKFVVPMGEVSEMLEVPTYTRLPGVKSWVRGVANVRGRLLPIFDLASYFGERLAGPRKQRRILILETENVYSGLMVDNVHGMQHFPVDTFKDVPDSSPQETKNFVAGSYSQAGHEWVVFSPKLLEQDDQFMNAAQN